MRQLVALVLFAAVLAAPCPGQQIRFHDIFVNGYVSVLDLGQGPRIVVSGIGPCGDFAGYWQGLTSPIVNISFDAVWLYDGNACRTGHVYAIYNSYGWTEQGYRLDDPLSWHPLPPGQLPGDSWHPQRGGYVTYSMGVCERWPSFGDNGSDTCPVRHPDGCIWGGQSPQFWAVVLHLSMR